MQRHRRYWQEPDAFDPDRHDRPETVEPMRQCYMPFSKGPRVCLGAAFAQQEAAMRLPRWAVVLADHRGPDFDDLARLVGCQ